MALKYNVEIYDGDDYYPLNASVRTVADAKKLVFKTGYTPTGHYHQCHAEKNITIWVNEIAGDDLKEIKKSVLETV